MPRTMRTSLFVIILMSYSKRSFCTTDAGQTTFKSITSTRKSPAENKSIQFVNIIKEDLRKNNDDYAEAIPLNLSNPYLETTRRATTHNELTQKYNITMKENNKFYYKKDRTYGRNLNNNKQRRAFDIFSQNSEEEINRTIPVTEIIPPATETDNIFTKSTSQPAIIAPALKFKGFTADKYPKYVNKDKMGKLKKFLDKNRGLMKDFISKKQMETQTVSMRAEESAEGIRLRVKPKFSDENPEGLVLPNSEQLDMAPAKGGRINILRVKGLLCERNVMVPEGPKYDSKGLAYLPEHAAAEARGRDYARTRAPPLVLPRCCNCCKKSVLGCE